MTTCLIREILYDYGNGNVDPDLKVDIDMLIALHTPYERLALKLFAYGFTVSEIENYLIEIPGDEIARFINSRLELFSTILELEDTRLYKITEPKKHNTLKGFLQYYSGRLDLNDPFTAAQDYRGINSISNSTPQTI